MLNTADPAVPSPALLKVLEGAVDLHVHSGPSPFPRRLNHVEASYDAARIGMRALLIKSHHHNTVMDLLAMESQLANAPTPVYGGVALNSEVGGINPSAVAVAIQMGGRAVWGPTVSAAQHIAAHNHDDGFPTLGSNLEEQEVSIWDTDGNVSAETVRVTQLVAEADIMLTGGHLDAASMKALFETAKENGVRRLLLHHPDFIVNASDDDVEEMLKYGAFVEHELSMYHPDVPAPGFPISRLVDWIEKIGPERTVIDSDLGQKTNPLPVDGYIHVIGQLLDHGVAEKDIRQMICRNTAFLLGLEESI
ncbi:MULTISPECIES: DUF6282 family protein [unclassified Arthrobacter]|uniref:DUF6282 family protein n=1 Tax=unclassified Arthrobacter TaxID=235627 RepID=UPI001D150FB8|nr:MULTISPECIES: DUF6282 family protein [unclassified Arthrobacter]MCC3274539.1 DUF6282 family protein [Arthrobacter sp. zg-Y20]MCC9177871.1 DUF6282 family protein [Arthrobacter sp. zg-Y750]MDK1314696.1 DUF6282 family protein [Arthrobacter sp. zg.Y20]WIB07675.1 DUF6282 family protein [Arthrobacter sp. zg-Y20]